MFDVLSSQYYKTLSEDIKEKVRESGVVFDTEDDLRQYVATLKR